MVYYVPYDMPVYSEGKIKKNDVMVYSIALGKTSTVGDLKNKTIELLGKNIAADEMIATNFYMKFGTI
jgi:hypothetical protein